MKSLKDKTPHQLGLQLQPLLSNFRGSEIAAGRRSPGQPNPWDAGHGTPGARLQFQEPGVSLDCVAAACPCVCVVAAGG